MIRRTGLARVTPLARTGWLTRRPPAVKHRPCKPGAHIGEHRARRLVRARSGGLCEICGQREATQWHHRKNRSQGGLWTPANGLDVCVWCHSQVTNTRTEYYLLGWCVERDTDPALVPAQLWHGLYLLTAAGDYAAAYSDLDEAS